jgi:hypothetical protein
MNKNSHKTSELLNQVRILRCGMIVPLLRCKTAMGTHMSQTVTCIDRHRTYTLTSSNAPHTCCAFLLDSYRHTVENVGLIHLGFAILHSLNLQGIVVEIVGDVLHRCTPFLRSLLPYGLLDQRSICMRLSFAASLNHIWSIWIRQAPIEKKDLYPLTPMVKPVPSSKGTLNCALLGTSWNLIWANKSSILVIEMDSGKTDGSSSSSSSSASAFGIRTFLKLGQQRISESNTTSHYTHRIKFSQVKRFLFVVDEKWLNSHSGLQQVLMKNWISCTSWNQVLCTISVVRAEVTSCWLLVKCGSSWLVIKNTRFEAVLGALQAKMEPEGLSAVNFQDYTIDWPVSNDPVATSKNITHRCTFTLKRRKHPSQFIRIFLRSWRCF